MCPPYGISLFFLVIRTRPFVTLDGDGNNDCAPGERSTQGNTARKLAILTDKAQNKPGRIKVGSITTSVNRITACLASLPVAWQSMLMILCRERRVGSPKTLYRYGLMEFSKPDFPSIKLNAQGELSVACNVLVFGYVTPARP